MPRSGSFERPLTVAEAAEYWERDVSTIHRHLKDVEFRENEHFRALGERLAKNSKQTQGGHNALEILPLGMIRLGFRVKSPRAVAGCSLPAG